MNVLQAAATCFRWFVCVASDLLVGRVGDGVQPLPDSSASTNRIMSVPATEYSGGIFQLNASLSRTDDLKALAHSKKYLLSYPKNSHR